MTSTLTMPAYPRRNLVATVAGLCDQIAMQAAEAALGTEYTGVVLGAVQTHDPYVGLTHTGVSWTGTYTDGNAVTGVIDLFWDPQTMNAISVTRAWYTTADGSEPEVAQERFMYGGVTDDIAFGIPNP